VVVDVVRPQAFDEFVGLLGGLSRSSSACTSSTGECRWSMVAMGEDSTARLVFASDDRRDRHAEQQEII